MATRTVHPNSTVHPHSPSVIGTVHATLRAFPIACFTLALLTDLAYIRTAQLVWQRFSEWLLFAGLVFGGIALLAQFIHFLVRRERPSWLAVAGAIVVLILALINSFIHARDGWTGVVPWGVTLSALTVLAMIVTGWLGRDGVRHV